MKQQTLAQSISDHKERFTDDEISLLRLLWVNFSQFVPAKIIEIDLGINERTLRGQDGLRSTTSEKLFKISGYKVVSGNSGYKMSDDPKEWQEAERRLTGHGKSEFSNVKHLREIKEGELFQ